MIAKPSEVFAERMRRFRERRGWSQSDLAAELTDAGWKVDRAQIARIELGDRGISLDEAIMISWALGLPPALIYLPLGEANNVALTPKVVVHPDLARKWVIGVEPTPYSDQRARMLKHHYSDMSVWRMHDRLSPAQEAVLTAERAVKAAKYIDDQDRLTEARAEHVRALKGFYDELQKMRKSGLLPPEIHEDTVESMRLAGINYDGPTWQGPGEGDEK